MRRSSLVIPNLAFCLPLSRAFAPQSVPSRIFTRLHIIAPPGSGYLTRDDEESDFPDTYDPMMEYPGTMRPGKTPENMPFQDLPIGDDIKQEYVPWPHFQQIDWHHRWDPPHEQPMAMDDFIEMEGRWATAEMEAEMRAGARRTVRERRELEESSKRDTIITDDDDDDDDDDMLVDEEIALGDGVYGKLGSTAAAIDQAPQVAAPAEEKQTEDDEGFDDNLDDFLLDLGLDSSLDDEDTDATEVDDDVGEDISASLGAADDLDLGLEEEDDLDEDSMPLEDFDEEETMDTEDVFDEGGFDFDAGDFDAGDSW